HRAASLFAEGCRETARPLERYAALRSFRCRARCAGAAQPERLRRSDESPSDSTTLKERERRCDRIHPDTSGRGIATIIRLMTSRPSQWLLSPEARGIRVARKA